MADSKTVKTITLSPRIDEEATVVLKANLIKLINDGARKIICDFSATEFLSQEGAEELVNVARFLGKKDGQLGICRIKPEVKASMQQLHLFKFYSVEESVAVVVLRHLVTYFEYYEDVLDLKVYLENDIANVEIFLDFDANKSMKEVQQTVNLIRQNLEQDIKDARVLIIPSTQLDETVISQPVPPKMQLVYSSKPAVVEQLAQAIRQTTQEDVPCIAIKHASPEDHYDLISVVLWVDRVSVDSEAANYLRNLHNQKIAIFAIIENYPYSGYAGETMKNIIILLDPSNTVVGRFVCQLKDHELSDTDIMRARNKYFDIIHDNTL